MRRLQSTFRACSTGVPDVAGAHDATAVVSTRADGLGAYPHDVLGGRVWALHFGTAAVAAAVLRPDARALAPDLYAVRLTGATSGATRRVTVMW